jgi:hypothetical protein
MFMRLPGSAHKYVYDPVFLLQVLCFMFEKVSTSCTIRETDWVQGTMASIWLRIKSSCQTVADRSDGR